jgi:hypothetical protein
MLLYLADTIQALFAPYDLAVLAHRFNGSPDFHDPGGGFDKLT